MSSTRLICCALSAAIASPALGNYADDTGFNQLKAELGAAMLTGNGAGMTQVEGPPATDAYMPQAGTGTFAGVGFWAGKSFTAKSGTALYSSHASEVGQHMYGWSTNPANYRSTMAPGVVDVDCYNANSWDDSFLAPSGNAPIVETRAVQNHSWIYEADAGTATTIRDLLRRQDFSINRDNYVCCVGLSNDPAGVMPDLFAAGYNVISVGVSDGDHSRGPTTPDMDGPGRRKPEIVAPLDATSFSTAYVSSAAALLREKANLINTTNARRTKTLKAVLLAGATKDKFPDWEKSATHPIDDIYGAGELNIYHSYHIMNGGEQPANDPAGRPYMAWDYFSLTVNGTADYRLNIPAGMYGVELSAFVVWHRTPTDTDPLPLVFRLGNDALVNFDLTLLRDPAAGGAAVTIDSSTSTLYNLEHVWKKDLPAGNYRLRVRHASGTPHEYSIAWRLTTAPHLPIPEIQHAGTDFTFTFPALLAGQPYKFQSSPDLLTWTDIESFTASGGTETRTRVVPAVPRLLYRLLPVLP